MWFLAMSYNILFLRFSCIRTNRSYLQMKLVYAILFWLHSSSLYLYGISYFICYTVLRILIMYSIIIFYRDETNHILNIWFVIDLISLFFKLGIARFTFGYLKLYIYFFYVTFLFLYYPKFAILYLFMFYL
jgi:hypothetical protein